MGDIENVSEKRLTETVRPEKGGTAGKTGNLDTSDEEAVDNSEKTEEKSEKTAEEETDRCESPRALWRYSKEEILKLRETPVSRLWPSCFSLDFKNEFGKWDPEAWHHHTPGNPKGNGSPVNVVDRRREQLEDGIVLSPQRRSFGHGCQAPSMPQQVIPERPKNGVTRNGEREFDGRSRLTGRTGRGKNLDYRERGVRSKDSPDIKRIGRDKDDDRYRDSRDHWGDRYNGKDYDKPNRRDMNSRKYSDSYQEEEPEWMTFGPTSQSETIELVGFQDKKSRDKEKKRKENEAKKAKKNEEKPLEDVKEEENKENQRNDAVKSKEEQEGKMFDINDLFKSENLLPPGFTEVLQNPGSTDKQYAGSRFTKWFSADSHSRSNSSSNSRNSSRRSSIVDEIGDIAGLQRNSRFLFAPISSPVDFVSPSILGMLNDANINVQPLLDSVMSQKREGGEAREKATVKGTIMLEDLENSPTIKGIISASELEQPQGEKEKEKEKGDSSAFLAFVKDMKAQGNLPEKPSPPIPGLPARLLPCPPETKTRERSPSPLEMIERAFARGQSPVNRPLSPEYLVNGPSPVMNRSVSPLFLPVQNTMSPLLRQGSPLQDRMGSPFEMMQGRIVGSPQNVLGQGMLVPGYVSPPVDMLAQQIMQSRIRSSPPIHRPIPYPANTSPRDRNAPVKNTPVSRYHTTRPLSNTDPKPKMPRQPNTPASSVKNSVGIPTAFTPTAVLRKLHYEKQEQKQVKDTQDQEREFQPFPGSPVLRHSSKAQSNETSEQHPSNMGHNRDMLSPQRQPLFHVPDVESSKERTGRNASTPDISPHIPQVPPNTPQSSNATPNSMSYNNIPNNVNIMQLIQNKSEPSTPRNMRQTRSPLTPHSLPLPETPRGANSPHSGDMSQRMPSMSQNQPMPERTGHSHPNMQHSLQTPDSLSYPKTRSPMSYHDIPQSQTPHSLPLPESPAQHPTHNMPRSTTHNTLQNENFRGLNQKVDQHVLLSPDNFVNFPKKNSGFHRQQQQDPKMWQKPPMPMGGREAVCVVQPQRRPTSPHFPHQSPANRGPYPVPLMPLRHNMPTRPPLMVPSMVGYSPSHANLHHLQNLAIQKAYAAQVLMNRGQHMTPPMPSPSMYNMPQHQGMVPQQQHMMSNIPLPLAQRMPSGMSQERPAPPKDDSLMKWFGEDVLKNLAQHHVPPAETPGRRVISVEELERQHAM